MDVCINGDQWRRALRLFPDHDFYHTYDYHVLGTAGDESLPPRRCAQQADHEGAARGRSLAFVLFQLVAM